MTGEGPLARALDAAAPRERLHMPGHFGRVPPLAAPWALAAAAWDQTESAGLDALSEPTGVLAGLSARAAAAYGASAAWLSVQGATLPMLAGALAMVPAGGRVLADRQSHRSVLAAAILGGWWVDWVSPARVGDPPDVADWLAKLSGPRPDAVLPLYPSYDGRGVDLGPVVAAAHARGSRVLVDAAHGAHLGRAAALPPHPLAWGPDLVAHGLHKTEPVLTQTGLLLAGAAGEAASVGEWMRRLSTSSPSYLLLASIDQYIEGRRAGDGGWGAWAEQMAAVWDRLAGRGFSIGQRDWARTGRWADPAKLTVRGDGAVLAARLRAAGFEPEHAAADGVTLIVGPALGYDRHEWERVVAALGEPTAPPADLAAWPPPGTAVLRPAAAVAGPRRQVALGAAAGLVAATEVTPYPPGVPVVVPGERISAEAAQWLQDWLGRGARVEGVEPSREGAALWVVDA